MKKVLYLCYQPYKWLFLLPFFIVNSVFFGILAVVISLVINQKLGSFIGGVSWARVNSFLTPISVKVTGKEKINKRQSYVIVANHQSAYDIFVLYGYLGIDFKWVMKKEIRKIPGVGFGSNAVGHIFIDRSNSKAAIETIAAAKSRIKDGTSVVIFPEGTRSKDGQLLAFKKGAFRFAFDLDLPVLPLTINGTDKIMPTGGLNIFPGKARLIIHDPIDINRFKPERINDLIQETRSAIQSGLS